MQQIAAERGIDLGGCASRTLNRGMLEAADVIFVMDRGQLEQIRVLFPDAYPRTHLLGMGTGNAAGIADPYGREAAVYARCLAHVTAAVDGAAAGRAPRPLTGSVGNGPQPGWSPRLAHSLSISSRHCR